jgi:phosphoribosylanthranilate isomerase
MTAVKICGITRLEDAQLAADLGASFVGVVLWPGSPRGTTLEFAQDVCRALPGARVVGVFVNPAARELDEAYAAGIRWAQIHGEVPAGESEYGGMIIVRAMSLDQVPAAPRSREEIVLLDAHDPVRHGGTGRTIDWARAAAVASTRRVMLAGGLTPANVREAIARVRPFAVDVASGVEASPGIKDPARLRAFMTAVKETA